MAIPLSAQLTEQFYHWERHGRGWGVYDVPVRLEPPFQPFCFTYRQAPIKDDGRVPNLGQQLSGWFKKIFGSPSIEPEPREIHPKPRMLGADRPLCALGISFPRGQTIGIGESEQLLLMLSYCTFPISFEIVATHREIAVQLVSREPDRTYVEGQIRAFFPDATLTDRTEYLDDMLIGEYCLTYDFGLAEEFMRPLAMPEKFDLDPYIGLMACLENLAEGEQALVQVLFSGTEKPWAENILRSVTGADGKPFFADAPEMLPLARQKVGTPLFGVTIRAVAEARNPRRAEGILFQLKNALEQMSDSSANSLIPLDTYREDWVSDDILLRQSHRSGMLLNSRELVTFAHFPSETVFSQKLVHERGKTKLLPNIAQGHQYVLGINEHQGREQLVSLTSEQRLKHLHIVGATGTGKSTLLLNLVAQDIGQGEGLAVLDPHGDLIDHVLGQIPDRRIKDVVLLDPSDTEYPIGFNILTAHSEVEKDILASDLVSAFRRLATSWGDQMTSVLANAILAFLESTRSGTLVDLRRFLIEKPYRDAFLGTVADPHVRYYWQHEYPLLKSSSIGSILTRLDTFLRSRIIRNMLAQQKGLDFADILNSRKILLVKLSQGLIGSENSYLLGTFIVSKIHQAALARQSQAQASRNNFFLYIDEFQHFATPSMASILSGARKYHLGLVLAHQDMQQLLKEDSELAGSVMANAGTRICFRVGDSDAKRFEDGFSSFAATDLMNLKTGEAIARIDRTEQDCNLRVVFRQPEPADEKAVERIVAHSRERYGTSREQVEERLSLPMGTPANNVREAEANPETLAEQSPAERIEGHDSPLGHTIYQSEVIAEMVSEPSVKKKDCQHRYLQMLIKRMAESRGFKAVIEEQTPDGKGRVDVALYRDEVKIACEITVTTTDEWEVHNIEKCLAAGFGTVVVCSTNATSLGKIQSLIETKLSVKTKSKVRFFQPEELFHFLDETVTEDAASEQRVKGYRVKVKYNTLTKDEEQYKKRVIVKSLVNSTRKK